MTLEHDSGDGGSDLQEQDEGKERSEGVEHAWVLGAGSAASEESDEKDDTSGDHQDDAGVSKVVLGEAGEVTDLEVDGQAESEDDASGHEDDKVAKEDDVFEHVAATVTHCALSVNKRTKVGSH